MHKRSRHDAAADWAARLLAGECPQHDHDAFADWCARDPANLQAWLDVMAAHDAVSVLRADPHLQAAARRAGRRGSASSSPRGWLRPVLALAAVAVIAIGVLRFGGDFLPAREQAFVTAIGEQRDVALEDGTRLRLDADTRVDVRMTRRARDIRLVHGRVRIVAGADASRPLRVLAMDAEIRDIGTTFQVSRSDRVLDVVLFEGKVRVTRAGSDAAAVDLAPGEQVRVTAAGIGDVEAARLDEAVAWTEGRIVFRNRRMDDLLAEFNRYSATPIRIAPGQPELAALRVSGTVDVDDRDSLLQALETGWGIVRTDGLDANAIELGRRPR